MSAPTGPCPALPRIIDSHAHVGLHRFEPVEALLFQMNRTGVSQAVLVHYGDGIDNDYLFDCRRDHPGRFVAVVAPGPDHDPAIIRHFAAQGAAGVRLSPAARSKGTDPFAIWRAADELGLVVSLHGVPQLLLGKECGEVLERFPDLPMVIEHLGFHASPKPSMEEYSRVLALARFPNFTLKLPGFGEYGATPPLRPPTLPPYCDRALEAFGPGRMMWGSDFPVVSAREGYGNSFQLPWQYFAKLTPDERAAIFGGTAARVWFDGERAAQADRSHASHRTS